MALAFLDDRNREFVDCLPHLDLRKHFEIIRELGRGCFAKVVLVRRRDTGELFAAKMVRLEPTSGNLSPTSQARHSSVHYRRARDQFQFELTLAYFLSPCPYIIRTQSDAFRTNNHLIALMEPALGGDLASKLSDPNTRIGEQQLKSIAIQLASAIQFIHERSLVHGDIRPENVLLVDSSLSVVKLGDFSRTKKSGSMVRYGTIIMANQANCARSKSSGSQMTTSSQSSESGELAASSSSQKDSVVNLPISGADGFSPPEIIELSPSDFYTVHASQDVWGYGMVLFCLCVERIPSWQICSTKNDPVFADFTDALNSAGAGHPISASATSSDLHSSGVSINGSLHFYQSALSRLTPALITLFRGLLDVDPSNRSPIKTVRNFTLQKWLSNDLKPKPLGQVDMPGKYRAIKNIKQISSGTSNPAIASMPKSKMQNSTTSFIRAKIIGSPNTQGPSGLVKAQSETALNDINVCSELKSCMAVESTAAHGISSTSTSFSADSTSDPASPKIHQHLIDSLIPEISEIAALSSPQD